MSETLLDLTCVQVSVSEEISKVSTTHTNPRSSRAKSCPRYPNFFYFNSAPDLVDIMASTEASPPTYKCSLAIPVTPSVNTVAHVQTKHMMCSLSAKLRASCDTGAKRHPCRYHSGVVFESREKHGALLMSQVTAGHKIKREAGLSVQKWKSNVQISSTTLQPTLISLAFDFDYLGDFT